MNPREGGSGDEVQWRQREAPPLARWVGAAVCTTSRAVRVLVLCLGGFAPASASAGGPDWVIESPHEFVALGRFRAGSDGSDVVVLDRASGLARVGLRTADGFNWGEQPLGMAEVLSFAVLRNGPVDRCAATSPHWNAIQVVTPAGTPSTPRTLRSPVVGPRYLGVMSSGQELGAVSEAILAFSDLTPDASTDVVGAMLESGTTLFERAWPSRVRGIQSLRVGAAPAVPRVVTVESTGLRVSRPALDGSGLDGFGVTLVSSDTAFSWTTADDAILAAAAGSSVLQQVRLQSVALGGGWFAASGVGEHTLHSLPASILGLDTIPFRDPAFPELRHLVVVRLESAPEVLQLYRLVGTPVVAEPVGILDRAGTDEFLGVLASGDEFVLLSGVGGRATAWDRYRQSAPGALPTRVESGRIPGLTTHAVHPNLFRFDVDPRVRNDAMLLGSERRLDWTQASESSVTAGTDEGSATGLGALRAVELEALGGVWIGNQLMPEASVASFGPIAALPRDVIRWSPPPGVYSAPRPGRTFDVQIETTTSSTGEIYYRLSRDPQWRRFEAGGSLGLEADADILAYFEDARTGARSALSLGTYRLGSLPALEPLASEDRDGDGLADAWERAFGIDDPESDSDSDGAVARLEFQHGTDPLDAGSRPARVDVAPVMEVARVEDGRIRLQWSVAVPGEVLEVSEDLKEWVPVSPQPVGASWSAALEGGGGRFFRLRRPQ